MSDSIWQRISEDPARRLEQLAALKAAVAAGEEPVVESDQLTPELLELLFNSALCGRFQADMSWIYYSKVDS